MVNSKEAAQKVQNIIFQSLFYQKSVILDPAVGAICKSPFMNKTFRTASWFSSLPL